MSGHPAPPWARLVEGHDARVDGVNDLAVGGAGGQLRRRGYGAQRSQAGSHLRVWAANGAPALRLRSSPAPRLPRPIDTHRLHLGQVCAQQAVHP